MKYNALVQTLPGSGNLASMLEGPFDTEAEAHQATQAYLERHWPGQWEQSNYNQYNRKGSWDWCVWARVEPVKEISEGETLEEERDRLIRRLAEIERELNGNA